MKKYAELVSKYTAVAIQRGVGAKIAASNLQLMLQGTARTWLNSLKPYSVNSWLDYGNRLMQAPLGIFGQSLAITMLRKQKLQAHIDFINRDLWRYWIHAQVKQQAENSQLETVFRDLKNYLKDPNSYRC